MNLFLDLSKNKKILDATHWYEEYNQLYHPTGTFGQDVADYVYIQDPVFSHKFAPLLFKEWFFLLSRDGYLIIDYKPNDILNFNEIEKKMWWLWKGFYEIVSHEYLSDSNGESTNITSFLATLNTDVSYFSDSNLQKSIPCGREDTPVRFVLRKKRATVLEGDSIDKWTFGIITNGERRDWMEEIISSIRKQKIPNYEIIVCGTYFDRNEGDFSYIPFNQRDNLGWITKKKNLIIENAKYENLCILHDRAVFSDNWYEEMKKYGNCFEIMCNKQLYKDMRAYDWTTLGGPNGTFYKMELLDYRDWDWWSVIGGLQIISKKSLISQVMLDETRYWNGMEDTELTFRMRDAGYIARINDAVVFSYGFRHGMIPSKPYDKSLFIPDMILRRIMRSFARIGIRIPFLIKFMEKFCSTNLYKKIIKVI